MLRCYGRKFWDARSGEGPVAKKGAGRAKPMTLYRRVFYLLEVAHSFDLLGGVQLYFEVGLCLFVVNVFSLLLFGNAKGRDVLGVAWDRSVLSHCIAFHQIPKPGILPIIFAAFYSSSRLSTTKPSDRGL